MLHSRVQRKGVRIEIEAADELRIPIRNMEMPAIFAGLMAGQSAELPRP